MKKSVLNIHLLPFGKKEILLRLIVALIAVAIASPSHASPVTFEFTGILPSVTQGLDPAFSPVVTGGETVRAIYTFDSALINSVPGTNEGYYQPLSAFQVNIGAMAWELSAGSSSSIYIHNCFGISCAYLSGFDFYRVSADTISGPAVAGMNAFSMGIDMTTNAFDFIPSDALPLTPPDLAPFLSPVSGYAVAKIQLVFLDASGAPHYLDSSITSAQIPQVPEPTVTLLLGIGLMGVAAIRRKYKN